MLSFSPEKFFQKEVQEFSFGRLFQQIFVDDWMMKLIALTITLALWFGVTGWRAPTTERLKNVTLKLRVSNDLEITNTPIEEVDLVIRGDTRQIDQIKSEDLIVSLDLGEIEPGDVVADITPETVNVDLPTGVKLEEIQPGKVAVKVERVEKREVPVKAQVSGELPDGYEIYGISAVPVKVPIRGPASYVNSLNYISTEKIKLEGRTGDFTAQQVPLNISNPKITVVDETSVDVFFRIGEKRIERLFMVPVRNMSEDRTATVVLYGPRSVLNSIGKADIEVEMVRSASGADQLQLGLPAEIQNQVERKRLRLNGK